MLTKFLVLAMLTCALPAVAAAEEGQPRDPIGQHLFSPEMIVHFQEQIELTEEQHQAIRNAVEEVQAEMESKKEAMESATAAVAEALEQAEIDEDEAVERLDRLFEIEHELKRHHLRMLIQVRNELTAEQRERLADLRPEAAEMQEVHERLEAKLDRVKAEVHERAEAGNPPQEIMQMMQKFPELMKAGRVQEAEKLLDQALDRLDE